MKLQFKVQQYQTDAVDAVVETFAGQPKHDGISYRIDPGKVGPVTAPALFESEERPDAGLRNAEIALSGAQLLENVHAVQRSRTLPLSAKLASSAAAPGAPNLDVEMETGTGKTYVYIKTIMELHKRYGWSKYIIVVPSVAIREGVKKSFDVTAEHFQQLYGTKPRSFIYNSSQLHELERFSSDAGVQVMIINIQAFNAQGKDQRRIYDELDDFQSRRPIDVVSANRPVVIIDEPQKIGAPKSLEALSRFNALMLLRYSATHKVEHTKVHRLDALDAYNQKLVKKIAVRGITVKGLAGSTAYLYLDAIEIAKGAKPRARVEIEVQTASGIKRQIKRLDLGSNLHTVSNGIEAYKDLFVTEVDANRDVIELSNDDVVVAGQLADPEATRGTARHQPNRAILPAPPRDASRFARSSVPIWTRSASCSARASRCSRCSSSTRSPSIATTAEKTLSVTTRVCSRRSTQRSATRCLANWPSTRRLRSTRPTCAVTTYGRCTRATSPSTRRPSTRSTARSPDVGTTRASPPTPTRTT